MNESISIPISALNQYAYCPRRCWWMHVAGEFRENAYTAEGRLQHDRVHTSGHTRRGDLLQSRRVYVFSQKLGIAGFADLIEESEGTLYPVEHKHGQRKPWKNDQIQLCAQALCLEEMNSIKITHGYIYYASTGRRLEVSFDQTLREETLKTIEEVRRLLTRECEPQAHYSRRCHGCSLYSICLPRETKRLQSASFSLEEQTPSEEN